jgi:hypothetical protein
MSNRISTKELIQELSRLNGITDGSPTQKEMNEMGQYSVMPYKDRFGSWNESLKEAGISPNVSKVSKEELIEELERVDKKSSGSPTQEDMNEVGEYSAQTYHRKFGSWNDALDKIGLSKNRSKNTEEELLRELRRLDDELDHSPSQSDIDEHGEYYPIDYQREFGSWNEAKVAAGLKTIEPGGEHSSVSTEDLIRELVRLYEEINSPPTKKDMQKLGKYSHQIYRRKLGSWNNALEEAGLEKSRSVEKRNTGA